MKTILSRIQQLEQRCAARTAAANTSGVAKLKAKLDRMAEGLRADPNWEPLSPSTAAELRELLTEPHRSRSPVEGFMKSLLNRIRRLEIARFPTNGTSRSR